MIRISQQDSAKSAKSYYSTADDYTEGQELIGSWGGKGAARLGLSGPVDQESFDRLCDKLDPQTGEQLTVRTRSERSVGYDFTFSVPKSVSLLYAMSGDEDVLNAFRSAVDQTMQEMEAEMKTRVRVGRQDHNRTTGNMAWAEVIHTTSRPVDGVPDPQLHAHVFVFNTTWDNDEERWKAGQFRELKRDAPYFQAAFRVRLAGKLQIAGFGIERKKDDFEIAGIPADVLGRYSRRTALIEQKATELDITDPDPKGELGAETREKKAKSMGWASLRKEWEGRLSNEERDSLAAVHRREVAAPKPERSEGKAVDHAIEHSFEREAVIPERKLLTEALKRGIGELTVVGAAQELQARSLIRREVAGRSMVTTKDMLAQEVADKVNARVILVGDRRQHRSVTAGEPLKLLEHSAGLHVAEVTEIL